MDTITLLPPTNDRRWHDLATGKVVHTWSTLAVNLLMTRLLRELSVSPSPAKVQRAVNEMHSFFRRNMAASQTDLRAMFAVPASA